MRLLTTLLFLSVSAWAEGTKPVVAVLYFDVHESLKEQQVFKKGLAEMLITDLVHNENLQVVERARLEDALTELKLQSSGKVDPSSAQKTGKLLGAKYLVFGSILPLGKTLSFETKVMKVETAKIVKTTRAQASFDDIFEAEQKLAEALQRLILEADAIAATPATPVEKPKRKVVLSFFTAAKYAGALDAKDARDPEKQKALLTQVVAEAPEFTLARLDLASLTK